HSWSGTRTKAGAGWPISVVCGAAASSRMRRSDGPTRRPITAVTTLKGREYRKFKRPFPPPACVPPCSPQREGGGGSRLGVAPPARRPRRECPRAPRAPGSHAPATLALSGFALRTCLELSERRQALCCEPGSRGDLVQTLLDWRTNSSVYCCVLS